MTNNLDNFQTLGFRDDDTVRWENLQTGEYLIQDNLGKIRTYGTN